MVLSLFENLFDGFELLLVVSVEYLKMVFYKVASIDFEVAPALECFLKSGEEVLIRL